MMKFINLVILFIGLHTVVAAQQTTSIDKLQQQVSLELSKANGLFAVAFKNLATGQIIL